MSPVAWAQTTNACDLNADAAVNTVDVQLMVNMILGVTPCSANITGPQVCDAVTLQRVVNAALGGPCVTDGRSVLLSWTASTSPNISGYRVYRSSTSGGPYTVVSASLVAGVNYTDTTVQSGQTYYYVVTALDSGSTQSPYSNQASATIPQ